MNLWLLGAITVVSTGVLVALTARMLRQGDAAVPMVRAIVVSVVAAAVGFVVSIAIQDEWRLWYGVIVEAIMSTFALVVAYGRGDDRIDRENRARAREDQARRADA